jgi:hypothetical protein
MSLQDTRSAGPGHRPLPDHRPLIVLELNELCQSLIERWAREGHLPNFRRLMAVSDTFTTRADVTDPALLEPWIQWYSIHTGLPYQDHKVFNLTEGRDAGYDDVYRMMIAQGRKVASFGSMNVAPFSAGGSLFMGDPWSEQGDASPAEFNTFASFVGNQVREHSNSARTFGAREYLAFARFMMTHGLSLDTVRDTLAQLAAEKVIDPARAWRRVTILDRLQFDLFAQWYRKARPDFATFFSNSVAHLQHAYWREMEPGAFKVQPSAEQMRACGDAIRIGYIAIDAVVGRAMRLARQCGARLMFVSALSQQPFLRYEDRGGQHFYRLHDASAFITALELDAQAVNPTMTHQYMAHFASIEARQAARERLDALRLEDGRQVFGCSDVAGDQCALYLGCQISSVVDPATPVIGVSGNQATRFDALFYALDGSKSGCHHPDGSLWIESGGHRAHAKTCSILDVLPTQIELLGLRLPSGLTGHSLMPALSGGAMAEGLAQAA